jgi:radical SAM superfamily enzyme YgiQ (UPF0313 family)
MSLMAVGAVLEGRYEYQIIDGNLIDYPLAELDSIIARSRSRTVLGVTVMPGPQLQQAVPLCRELKRRHHALTIVWGGYFPTQHWDACLRSEFVDFVVRGHSEMVFLQLLTLLDVQGNNSTVPPREYGTIAGLAYRDDSGNPVTNTLAPIPLPEKLPAWNFDRLPMERYVRPTFLGSRTLGYHSSYGCPFSCNFCAVVNMVNGRWFPQTAQQVAKAVMDYRQRWSVNAVEFYDNNFFTNQSRVAEFSERIMNLDIAWWGEGRIDTMQLYAASTWRLMRDAGLKMVFMGAESGSDETLKRMDKGGKMSVMGNPPEPESDMRQTMEFIRKVKKVNPNSEIIMYLYTPVPLAGDLYEDAKAEGFSFPETLDEWVSPEWLDFSQWRSTTMPWIKRTLQEQIYDFERVINAYYPTSTDTKLTKTWRTLLRAASAWRYHLRFYHFPFELRALHRAVAYQRPETSGF